MAGEFHHDIRRNAVGEGEADEGLSAGVGANLSPLWVNVIVADAVAVEGDVDGGVEFAYLAKVFEAAVHLLVGHVREGLATGERFVFVFLKDCNGVLVVILLFGGKKIPELMKGLGQGVRSFKQGMSEVEKEIKEIDEGLNKYSV